MNNKDANTNRSNHLRDQNDFEKIYKDPSTLLYNKRYFLENSESFALKMIRDLLKDRVNKTKNGTWSIMFCDIDGLKYVNDTRSHFDGDEGILAITEIIKSSIRTQRDQKDRIIEPDIYDANVDDSIPIRYGGDEFIIILPNCTKEEALMVARRIKDNIKEHEKETKNMTLSIGIADTTEIIPPSFVDGSKEIVNFLNLIVGLAEQRMYIDKKKDIKNLPLHQQQEIVARHLIRLEEQIGIDFDDPRQKELFIDILESIRTVKKETKIRKA